MTICLSCNTFGARLRYDQQLRVTFLLQGLNQSVEDAGVAFVKGAYERNCYFEKKSKQTVIYNEEVRTNKAKDYQSQGRTDLGINFVVYHCANRTV